jgi:hypothetical protein
LRVSAKLTASSLQVPRRIDSVAVRGIRTFQRVRPALASGAGAGAALAEPFAGRPSTANGLAARGWKHARAWDSRPRTEMASATVKAIKSSTAA